MSDISSGIFAVAGALIGSGSTVVSQASLARRQERHAAHAERITASASFAAAVTATRRVQFNRWHPRAEVGRNSPEHLAAKQESYERRARLWHEFYKAELVMEDEAITGLAPQAIDLVSEMHEAASQNDLARIGDEVRRMVEKYVRTARRQLSR